MGDEGRGKGQEEEKQQRTEEKKAELSRTHIWKKKRMNGEKGIESRTRNEKGHS